MYNSKISTLIEMTKEGKISKCSLVGIPTKEVTEAWIKCSNLTKIFDKYHINYSEKIDGETSIGIYFADFNKDENHMDMSMYSIVTIVNPSVKDIRSIKNNLFKEVIDCYQVFMPPAIFNKVLGISSNKLTFSDMLLLIPESTQSNIASKINRSPQALTDIKSGKNNLTIEILSKLMNLYPLLPWEEFIRQQDK